MLRVAESTDKTHTGLQRRDNEDSKFARAPVFVVADGMGGAQAGEVASRMAIDVFEQGLPPDGTAEERLAARVREANRRIHDLSRTQHERAGMGTTLTAAYLAGDELVIAHVGDSRAYLFRDGELKRLTQDHSLVDELVRRGKLTEEQAAEHPQRSIITRALGPEARVEVDTWSYPVRAGDVVLLCSDGLTSMVSEERVAEILDSVADLDSAAQALIDEANAEGGRDNITVVLFRLEDVGVEGTVDEPTLLDLAAAAPLVDGSERVEQAPSPAPPPTASTAPATKLPRLARTQGRPPAPRRRRHFGKPLAAVLSAVIVLFLVGGGGYLASRQLYFIGTNSAGVVTVYRGLPYELPAGIKLYETFYVSGLPAALVPADRRKTLFDHKLRSQRDASNLVRDLELAKVQ
jgi:protein phosphatase